MTLEKAPLNNQESTGKHITKNVMEDLVMEEIQRQLIRYPKNISKYINQVEVATYALNRLPPLYASSHKGFNRQRMRGKSELQIKITKTVKEGILRIQDDLLRDSNPLTLELDRADQELQEAQNALYELAEYLPSQDISWKNIVKLVKPILMKLNQRQRLSSQQVKTQSHSTSAWDGSVHQK